MAQHFSTPTQETQHIHLINEIEKLRTKLQAESEQHIQCGINENKELRRQLDEYGKVIEKLEHKKLEKEIDDLRLPVTETAEYQIKELTEQLNKAKLTINNLNKENRNSKDEAELSQAQQEKEKLKLKLKISQQENEKLKLKLKDANKKYLQKPLEKGELRICDNDCVLCSLLWICHHKLQVYPCGRHLEKILTIEAERKYGTNPVDLCCEKFMDILRKCGIVVDKFERKFLQNKIDKQIDEVWQKLLTVDAKKLVVMVGMEFPEPGRLGHVIVCDLKSRDKGTLEYNDLQNDVEGIKVNEEAFKKAVRNNKGISLFTVDTDELAKKINDHKDILHTTNYKANPTGTSSATTKHGVCNTSAADDTEHAAAYVRGSLRAIPITERAAGDTERAARNTERAACDTNSAACDTERAACDAERAVCNTDSAAYDAESGVLGL